MQVGQIRAVSSVQSNAAQQLWTSRRELQAAVLAARGTVASARQEVQRVEAADRYGSLPMNDAAGDESRVDLYL